VIIVDLNHFKHVNDGLGHKLGDLVLTEAGRRIKAVTRNADTVARIGGDEFALVVREVLDEVAAWRSLAIFGGDSASLPRNWQRHPRRGEHRVRTRSGDGHDAETLIQKADMALHRQAAKRRIAAFCVDDSAGFTDSVLSKSSGKRCRRGIDVAYQPIVDAEGRPGLERWPLASSNAGRYPSDQFIPLPSRNI